jgi:hypothetical protein
MWHPAAPSSEGWVQGGPQPYEGNAISTDRFSTIVFLE